MPEIIEPTNPEDAAEEIAALQDVPAEEEDVQAHSEPISDPAGSTVSLAACA